MRLSFAFRLSSYLLALAGFFSLVLTGNLPPLIVIPALLAFGINLVQLLTGGGPIFSKKTWYGMTLVVFALFIIDTLWISQSILHSTTHFLTFLMINKLFNLSTPKDYLQLYLISFLQLLAASGLSPGLSYALSFLIYLVLAVWTLILYHLQREVEDQGGTPFTQPLGGPSLSKKTEHGIETVINLPFFTATNIVAVSAFTIALFIFFMIPRVGTGMFQRNNTEIVKVSGFSESVRLGTIGPVKLDPTVVMRVVLLPDQQVGTHSIYLRGTAFDFYDGNTWKKSPSKKTPLPQLPQGDFFLSRPNPKVKTIRQEIITEPLDTPILFGLSQVSTIRGRFTSLFTDTMGTINLPYTPPTRFSYHATSQIIRPSKNDMVADHVTLLPSMRQRYLQLPDQVHRVRELAQTVTEKAKSNYLKAKVIEGFLKSNFTYTLDIPPSTHSNPVEEFLFYRKSGYCEHYATAMVLMLRTLGIPARMVSGFLPTEWNDYGNYFTIRQRDAHTWVEVFFPDAGWIDFDPTPAVGIGSGLPFFSTFSRYLDTLRLKWDRYVINYSFRDQTQLIKNIQNNAKTLQTKMNQLLGSALSVLKSFKFSGNPKAIWTTLLAIALLSAIAIYLYKFRKKKRPHRDQSIASRGIDENCQKAIGFYIKMQKILARYDIKRAPFQTPMEFVRNLRREEYPFAHAVSELTQIYYKTRFGHLPLSVQDEKRIQELLQTLKTEIQGHSRRTVDPVPAGTSTP